MRFLKTFVSVLTCLAATVHAQVESGSTGKWTHPDTHAAGWKNLFDDQLSDAIRPKGEGGKEVWHVADGVLTATEDQAIWTKAAYGDCVLDLEFKNESGTNSGVIVYASDIDNWIPNSVEIQIADDFHEKWAKSPKSWQCGAVFGRLPASRQVVKPAGEWNHYTIFCEGKMIRVVLNGELVAVLDMSKWTDAKHNPDGSDIPEWLSRPLAELPTHGQIGLQGKHGAASIHFRNMRIKPL